MPVIVDFPGCCNAYVMHGFGGSPACQRIQYGDDIDPDEIQQRQFIETVLNGPARQKLIVATTNSEQKITNGLLKEYGFQRTKSMDKVHHSETKLIMWWLRPAV